MNNISIYGVLTTKKFIIKHPLHLIFHCTSLQFWKCPVGTFVHQRLFACFQGKNSNSNTEN